MAAECPPDLFKEFESSTCSWLRPEGDGQQFLYDALGEHMEFTGLTSFTIAKLDKETFEEWEKFEYWCDEMKHALMWKIVDVDSDSFQSAYEKSTPKKYFKSKSVVKEKIIEVLSDGASEDIENIMCVEIQCKTKKLFLIYFDSDAWTLGHGDSVFVV